MKKLVLLFVLVLFSAQFSQAQWEPDVRLTNDSDSSMTSYNMSWSVAAIDDFVHVVWKDNRNWNWWEIYYKRSTDGGISWGSDIRLTNIPERSSNPSIAVSGSNVHIAWEDHRNGESEIYYKHSTDNGLSWGPDIRLTDYTGGSRLPSISVSGSVVHVVWYFYYGGSIYDIYYKHSTDGGVNWEADVQLTDGIMYAMFPSVASSGANVHVVWNDYRSGTEEELYYKHSNDQGVNWSEDMKLTDVTSTSKIPSIAVSETDVHVVWMDFRHGYSEIYYKRSQDEGLNWGEDIRLTDDIYSSSLLPNIALAGPVVHVVWQDNREGNYHIYYKRSDDVGENWGEDTLISENGVMSSENPSVAVSGSAVHVVWNDDRDGNYEIYYKRDLTGGIPVGIENELPRNSNQVVSLYPNPASTILNINFNSQSDETITLQFMDMSGKTFRTYNFKVVKGVNKYTINLEDFRNGVYLIGLTYGTNRIFRKVIIKK